MLFPVFRGNMVAGNELPSVKLSISIYGYLTIVLRALETNYYPSKYTFLFPNQKRIEDRHDDDHGSKHARCFHIKYYPSLHNQTVLTPVLLDYETGSCIRYLAEACSFSCFSDHP